MCHILDKVRRLTSDFSYFAGESKPSSEKWGRPYFGGCYDYWKFGVNYG
jgi:hypothetical protein